MAISEFEEHRLESILKKFCDEKGPPAHIRDQLQWGFRIDSVQQTDDDDPSRYAINNTNIPKKMIFRR